MAPPTESTPWRCNINFPGRLLLGVEERMEEMERGTFSRYAVELVCFDLRIRREHSITAPMARQSVEVQDCIDRELLRMYRPGLRERGEVIRSILNGIEIKGEERDLGPGLITKERRMVIFPALHSDLIDIRWRELGFANVSEHVTSLIRYDLLIGGKHLYFTGDDCQPDMIKALDRETAATFEKNRRPKTKADYLVEEVMGRECTKEERDEILTLVGKKIIERAIRHAGRIRGA